MSLTSDLREDVSHIWHTMRFELKKHLRRRRLIIAMLLALALPLVFFVVPLALHMDFPKVSTDYISGHLGFVSILTVICATFFGGDAISAEYDKRTCLFSFALPQRRTSLYVGKYLAAFQASGLMISIYYGVVASEALGLYGPAGLPAALATSYAVAMLYALAALSVAFLFSSLLKSVITSSLLAFFALFMILPIVQMVLQLTDHEPWYILTYHSGLISSVFGKVPGLPMEPTQRDTREMGFATFSPQFDTGLEVIGAYAGVLFLVAICIALYREVQ